MTKKMPSTHLTRPTRTFIGCSGFSERLWKPFFYPETLAAKDYLAFYSQHLNAVEINSTFYRQPTLKTLTNWYQATPEHFKFFIKIPKTISHLQKLTDTHDLTQAFCEHIAGGLQEKLAGFLFQLPPSFHYNQDNLQKLLATVDSRYVNVVEFRHKSWWEAEIWHVLAKHHITMAGVSFPKDIPDTPVICGDMLYYRLHGVPVLFKSEYSEVFLQNLAEQIKDFKGEKYVFFNNTFGTAGIKNASYLSEYFSENLR